MSKLYYITRSYPTTNKTTGGEQMRARAVELFRKMGLEVWVILADYNRKTFYIDQEKRHILIPLDYNIKTAQHLESLGLMEDYMDRWVKTAINHLKPLIHKNDILFATSGGELGTIKLASKLKELATCKYIANFRDPVMYTSVFGEKIYHPSVRFKCANRDKAEAKYLKNADRIITSSNTYKESLALKYPQWETKIYNNHFGYIKSVKTNNNSHLSKNNMTIVYGGNMGQTQSPEILAKAVEEKSNIEAIFIGNFKKNKHLSMSKCKNIYLKDSLSYADYNKLVTQKADVGFTSLIGLFSKACVPSKIYEYINLELPILGVFEDGDAKDIINKNGYGIACSNNKNEISLALEKLQDPAFRKSCIKNIQRDKPSWSMEDRIQEVVDIIKSL